MGFSRWMMTHFPGSVGSAAKAMAMAYKKLKAIYPEASHDELLLRTLRTRYSEAELNFSKAMKMVGDSQWRLDWLTIEVIYLENPTAQDAAFGAPEVYREMLEVVMEVTKKFAPEAYENICNICNKYIKSYKLLKLSWGRVCKRCQKELERCQREYEEKLKTHEEN